MNSSPEKNKPLTMLLLGRTGSGKSFLGNLIADEKIFEVGEGIHSHTGATTSYTTNLRNFDNVAIKIVDTPGFADNRPGISSEKLLANILCFLKNLEEGFHVAIYCLPAKNRVDAHEIRDLQLIRTLLGKDVFKHTLFAVTQGDIYKPDEKQNIFRKFQLGLINILSDSGLIGFGSKQVLFADAEDFQAQFLKPLFGIIQDIPIYQPQISQDLDLNNPESVIKILGTPQMQSYMNQYIKLIENKTKEIEELKETLEQQATERERVQSAMNDTRQENLMLYRLIDQSVREISELRVQVQVLQNARSSASDSNNRSGNDQRSMNPIFHNIVSTILNILSQIATRVIISSFSN